MRSLSIDPATETVEKAITFLELLARWNKVTNLTAVGRLEDMVAMHLMDSLSVNFALTGGRVIDVGSGGGLPGIPLALVNSDKDFILLDSNGKKTRFITQAKIELALDNVEVVQARVEDYQGSFDHVISRAFASLEDFYRGCRHLVVEGGNLLAMKGPGAEAEFAALGVPGKVTRLDVPGIEAERYLVVLESSVGKPALTNGI